MKIIRTIRILKKEIGRAKNRGLKVGFVPTMGALHQGHLNLMRRAKKENDLVAISVFVNPKQFGPKEDFTRYPRDLNSDAKLARTVGVDIIFAPNDEEMYQTDFDTFVETLNLANKLCGRSRSRHFRGVLTVVMKLFNIVEPDTAYFGQKDYQQAQIVKKMVSDLNMNLRVKVLPTVRERDGLAMSSRNRYLSLAQRMNAYLLYKSLLWAKKNILAGEKNPAKIISGMKNVIKVIPQSRIDYIEIVDPVTLEKKSKLSHCGAAVLLAVHVGKTRLIDNIIICES